jgi:hypothetical protein
MILGALAGAYLWCFRVPGITDGPTQDMWFAECWFVGACGGAAAVILIRLGIALIRKRFRTTLTKLWFLEIVATGVMLAGFGRSWRSAVIYHDVLNEKWTLARESSPDALPNFAEIYAIARDQSQSPASLSIIYISNVVAVIGFFFGVYGLLASLADLETRLPEKADSVIALTLVGIITLVGLLTLFMLGRGP